MTGVERAEGVLAPGANGTEGTRRSVARAEGRHDNPRALPASPQLAALKRRSRTLPPPPAPPLGLMEASDYQKAVDFPNIQAQAQLKGRSLDAGEIAERRYSV